jgi:hypothetical protein
MGSAELVDDGGEVVLVFNFSAKWDEALASIM